MNRSSLHLDLWLLLASLVTPLAGCGTTRSTDTTRTATEQLLISDAIDRAVQSVSVQTLAGQSVFLDDSRLTDSVDKNYLISTLRQHLLATGCQLRDKREDADFVVEARAGAIGTDRDDLLFGIPSMSVPQIMPLQTVPAAIPEIPVAKRRQQRGVVKIALFAYHRATGTPVWQSGLSHKESTSNDLWILGAGPFQRGTIYQGTEFAGSSLGGEESVGPSRPTRLPPVDLAHESTFNSPQRLAQPNPKPATEKAGAQPPHDVVQASHAESPSAAPAASPPKSEATTQPTNPDSAGTATAVATGLPDPTVPASTTAQPPSAAPPASKPKPPAASAYIPAALLPQPRFDSR